MMLLKHAVDEAFARMALLYGRDFTGKFNPDESEAVKAAWVHELASVPQVLDRISFVMKHLPERPPTGPAFRRLCEAAPAGPQQLAMVESTAPVRGPDAHELAALLRLRDDIKAGTLTRKPGRQWAHDIVAAHLAGQYRGSTCSLRMAQEVAGVPRDVSRETITGMTPDAVIVDEFRDFYGDVP